MASFPHPLFLALHIIPQQLSVHLSVSDLLTQQGALNIDTLENHKKSGQKGSDHYINII